MREAADLDKLGEGSRNGGQVHAAVEVLDSEALQALEAGDGAEGATADIEPVAASENGQRLQALEEQAAHDAEGDHGEVMLVHKVDKVPVLCSQARPQQSKTDAKLLHRVIRIQLFFWNVCSVAGSNMPELSQVMILQICRSQRRFRYLLLEVELTVCLSCAGKCTIMDDILLTSTVGSTKRHSPRCSTPHCS